MGFNSGFKGLIHLRAHTAHQTQTCTMYMYTDKETGTAQFRRQISKNKI